MGYLVNLNSASHIIPVWGPDGWNFPINQENLLDGILPVETGATHSRSHFMNSISFRFTSSLASCCTQCVDFSKKVNSPWSHRSGVGTIHDFIHLAVLGIASGRENMRNKNALATLAPHASAGVTKKFN